MKNKLIILFLILGVGFSAGCKKDTSLDERTVIEIINQDKAETAVKTYMKDGYKYKPVSFKRLVDEGNIYSIEHTYKWTNNNASVKLELGKEYTSTYVFVLDYELTKVITIRENF